MYLVHVGINDVGFVVLGDEYVSNSIESISGD